MTASVGLLAGFGDLLGLMTLAAAVANPRMSQVVRPLVASFAFIWAWLLTAVCYALGASAWTTFTGAALIVASVVVITFTVHIWTQGDAGRESGPGPRGDHGGGGPRRQPDAPQHGGGGSDPSWWPDFERQLTFYLAECENARRSAALSTEAEAYAALNGERFPGRWRR